MTQDLKTSCLVKKLGHYTALNEADGLLLRDFEREELTFKKRDMVRREGEQIHCLFVVKSGWFFGHSMLPSGKRQVHRVFLPGDFIGTHEIVCSQATYDISAASKGTLCPFEKAGLNAVFTKSPRLTALLYSIEALDQVTQDDRLRAVSRMDAAGRLAHFFLQIFSRLRISGEETGSSVRLEMSQELIGDTLGLTGIHVNRTLKQLGDEDLIDLSSGVLTLKDEAGLKALCDFDDRHYRIDTSWFPSV